MLLSFVYFSMDWIRSGAVPLKAFSLLLYVVIVKLAQFLGITCKISSELQNNLTKRHCKQNLQTGLLGNTEM